MNGDRTNRRNIIAVVLIAAVLILVYWPSLRWMVTSWLSSDYYSHGFLVPVISGFIIWTKRDLIKKREPSSIGIWWIVAGAILYILSFLWQMQVLGALSFLVVITGLIFTFWGTQVVKALAFPLVFLLIMVPFWFIQDLAYNLQYISVHWAAWLTKVMQLPITTSGTEIHLGNNITFTVGIVCSGINTLVALMALSAVYAFILKGPVYKRSGLFILAFPIAIAANVLRISSIIVMAYFTNVEFAAGFYHDISSPIFFFIAFIVLILIGRAMKFSIKYEIFGKY